MAIYTDLDCDPCDGFDTDFSELDGCDSDCEGDNCQEGCGEDVCAVVVCLTKIESSPCAPCDINDDSAGMLTDVMVATGEKGVRFFSKDNTVISSSEKSFDDEDACTIAETTIGNAKVGNKQLCWLNNHLNIEVARFVKDGCNKIRVYGIEGGYKLKRWTETNDSVDPTNCGIEYEFRNTTKKTFKYVDYVTAGYPTTDEFFEYLLAL